jgi:hypothetical protein
MSRKNTVYENLNILYNSFVVAAAEIGAYEKSWGAEFSVSQISRIFNNRNEIDPKKKWFDVEFSQSDFQGLSAEQLTSVGFRKWDNDFSFLIPLYLLNYLNREDTYHCISGDTEKVSDFDNDNRYGCLAYYLKLVN